MKNVICLFSAIFYKFSLDFVTNLGTLSLPINKKSNWTKKNFRYILDMTMDAKAKMLKLLRLQDIISCQIIW